MHRHIKVRKARCQSINTAKNTLKGIECIYALYKKTAGLFRSGIKLAFKLKPDCHCTSKYLNNLIEQDHRHIKVRKARCQSINTAKNTLKGIECIYALYKKNRRSLQIYGFRHAKKLASC